MDTGSDCPHALDPAPNPVIGFSPLAGPAEFNETGVKRVAGRRFFLEPKTAPNSWGGDVSSSTPLLEAGGPTLGPERPP